MNRHALRISIAKALRGDHHATHWDDLTAAARNKWLFIADLCLAALDQHKLETSMLSRLERHLVDDWRSVLKSAASIRLAVAAPALMEGLWYVLSSAPPELRAFISLPVFVLVALCAVVARLWKQGNA